jgi:hypothetical protein
MKILKNSSLVFISIFISLIITLNFNECFSGPILNKPTPLHYQTNFPFKLGEKFVYKVNLNGIYVGRIRWEYLGRLSRGNIWIDVLSLSSNVKILKLFFIQTKEKLYIDSHTHLPLRVERQVRFFGRREEILEEYNQKENYVRITKVVASKTEEKIIHIKAPIHNVIALLYFFPKDIKLRLGRSSSFNLPTQKINIKVTTLKMFDTLKGSYEVYVLEGKPRNFKIWLEKEKRIPLRIEFPVTLGRISIFIN